MIKINNQRFDCSRFNRRGRFNLNFKIRAIRSYYRRQRMMMMMMRRGTTASDTAFQNLIPAKLSLQLQVVLKYVDAIQSLVLKLKLSKNLTE